MKILVVHNNYQQPGGELAAVRAQMDLLRQHNQEVVAYYRDSQEINQYGILQKAHFFAATIYNKQVYREVCELVKKEKPDVAHVHNVFPLISPAVYQALHSCDVPIVQTIHNYRFLCPNGLFYTQGAICERCAKGNTLHAVHRRCFRDSYVLSSLYGLSIGLNRRNGVFGLIDQFIALTEFTADKLIESGLTTKEKIHVLGNFLPDPVPDMSAKDEEERYMLFIGRISAEKGVQVLLEAAEYLPHIRLMIGGDGPLHGRFQEIVKDKKLDHVRLLGYQGGEEKWSLLQKASALIVPSVWYESFGISAIEAMASGTPVIASNIGGLGKIIVNGHNGLLFETGNAEDLRAKMEWLWENRETATQMGANGRMEFEEKYSSIPHYKELLRIYSKAQRNTTG